ncbi:E3 ubiquitin-protein ligase rififylin [Rhinatrema bivittatum]|uniref:E3 ubiquitin-protein ligase rififylin n=1 Tax=Rhinatrema bivittatum TaxID=194408 RepID=UPI001129A7BB|nr:E3 ubiquitin-protein ligase rififylin [Rhinatrema bivittatum]XP_029468964.1 E3 ubiquitin-protein ligase rififylin [Rhinatrema bivittatum]XP_029468965.1 E3 ubiquitin-protein ligase rififylin [Rhinatrema bivittatum]XP_029468967.1 E3 ubiquitin-protein ligase rififylin [Rhinatrema bivittatum]XP_029468968.1 E3 ubiquitin-protein ligase rififylin [Rhinatrema bivittatum]
MWASCCNWLCLDTQPEEMSQQSQSGVQAETYSNPGYNPHPSPSVSENSCKACGSLFENLTRKHSCTDCRKNFCASCFSQSTSGPCFCHLCERFQNTAFLPEELMKMKVKDLRDYLFLHEVSTEMCREKEDLVGLVLSQQPITARDNAINGSLSDSQVFLSQTHTSTDDVTSLRTPSLQREMVFSPSEQAQDNSQNNGHIPPPREGTPDMENAARAPTEDETQSTDSEDILVPGRRASLSDIVNVEDIEALTVRQLKEILARNFVNYKGCCEKWELMERVTRLYHEQKNLHLSGVVMASSEENLCKVCMDSPIDCVLLECGHMVTCTKCGKRMSECPICRQYVVRAVHVFRS